MAEGKLTFLTIVTLLCALLKPARQVAKHVTSPLLDSEMGVVFVVFRPILEVLAMHSRPAWQPTR